MCMCYQLLTLISASELKQCAFFKGIDWDDATNKKVTSHVHLHTYLPMYVCMYASTYINPVIKIIVSH